jgi:ketosteroid isomerase-like protein
MHRFLLSVAIFGGLAMPTLADVSGDERDLKRLTADIQTAVVEENLAFLENVLHSDYVHTRPNGVVSDRAQFLASVKQDEAEPNVNYDKLTSTDVAVRLYGDTAVLTGRSGIVSDDARGTLEGETRWTRIFLRQNGTWKLVAFQATLVPKK